MKISSSRFSILFIGVLAVWWAIVDAPNATARQNRNQSQNQRQGTSALSGQATSPGQRAQNPNRRTTKRKPPTIYWPKGVGVDQSIPTPKQFFGFEVGHRHLRHDQIAAYMRELARVSDRVTIRQYGQTHGGRPCLMLTITSPSNHSQINDIRKRHRQLAKPRPTDTAIDISNLPVVMNMGYGVHGDEPSATNTSPLVAHYLAAAQGKEIEEILSNSVILLDPSLNPDGFDRFARWANTFRGKTPNPDSAHIEHNQGWPPGRVNYYWFDLNRDWLPVQHPESRGRVSTFHRWKPNVVLDFHEMGTDSTYFFQPGIPERKNPLTPMENLQLTADMAQFHSKDLDQRGSLYFTQEVFDDFYMGKGSTYPDLHGAVGILFEQGSSRGHVQESSNGIIRFSDTIANQFTASLSSLKGATALREKLINYKIEFYRQSMALARKAETGAYAFSIDNNRTRLQKFADILLRHDIDCFWLDQDQAVDGQVVKAGSLIVPTAQPEYRFLLSLIERRQQFQEPVFYDVSAWTLPLAFNLDQQSLKTDISAGLTSARIGQRSGRPLTWDNQETVSLFIDWRDDAAARTLQQLLANDIHVRVARKPMEVRSGDDVIPFGYGSISVPWKLPANRTKRKAIRRILNQAAKNGVRVVPVTSGLATSGIDLGSNNFPRLEPRKVALIVGSGVSAYQAGAAWHQLDHHLGMPVTLIPESSLANSDLSRYNTVVLVSGRYDLTGSAGDRLRRFSEKGGTIVAISGAAYAVQSQILNIAAADSSEAIQSSGNSDSTPDNGDGETKMPAFSEAGSLAALDLVSGAIFGTQIDITHPLMYGFESGRLPVFRGGTKLLGQASPPVSNPARYLDEPLLAGYASESNQRKIALSPAATVHQLGQGRAILIADDPNFRAFWPATSRMFMNAVFFGDLTRAGR